ncbi:oxidase [Elizabethkingia anophelis]|uniref:oxidase n=1 Tax=Elizabethkingia anophelis TaxID=1117645 RepID=UPI001319860F|nr:oxidase [Elizabethkingia anophelis]MBE9393732.1 oxidase [Elizabethkingia anophelis]MBE9405667.1 oxidase [Elizabethkingia anophelis]MCT4306025.1 oxidase [Elizabethkingia anophelis]MCT4314845.1 oxidase [Elizabethkingia anophelis]UTF97521.1 oxidase [Elizabethkingia anophelis]
MNDLILKDGELSIVNGDFEIGESTQQEIENILIAFKGEYKQHPLLGAELQKMLKARNTRQGITREVNEQLQYDGFRNIDFKIEDAENFTIKAQR